MISFSSCADAYAAGYANIKKGQPGYARKLDRDNDGIACDTPPAGFTPRPTPSPTTPATTEPTSKPSPTKSSSSSPTSTSTATSPPPADGPQLPLTGPGELTGIGLVLALGGAAAVVAVKRRQRKFVP